MGGGAKGLLAYMSVMNLSFFWTDLLRIKDLFALDLHKTQDECLKINCTSLGNNKKSFQTVNDCLKRNCTSLGKNIIHIRKMLKTKIRKEIFYAVQSHTFSTKAK